MAGGVGRMGPTVGKWVVVLNSGVKLGALGMVQAVHAAPRAVLVWTLSQVAYGCVKPSRQISV